MEQIKIKILTWNVYWEGLVANLPKAPECGFNFEEKQIKEFNDFFLLDKSILTSIQQIDARIQAINKEKINSKLIKEMKKISDDLNKQTSLYNKSVSKCKDKILNKIDELHEIHKLDFICLQEASNLYSGETPLFKKKFIEDFEPINHKLKFNSIITLINTKKYEFYRDRDTNEKKNIICWGFDTSRPFIIAKVFNKITRKNVIIINVHFPHLENKIGDTRDLTLIGNLKYLISLFKNNWDFRDYKNDQIIIAGDFNDEISKKIGLFDLVFDNESSSINGDQIKVMRENNTNVNRVDLIPTCCYNLDGTVNSDWTPKNYDHILINDKLKYNFIHYPIKPAENKSYSDHLPILATLEEKVEAEGKAKGGFYEKYMKYKLKYLRLKAENILI